MFLLPCVANLGFWTDARIKQAILMNQLDLWEITFTLFSNITYVKLLIDEYNTNNPSVIIPLRAINMDCNCIIL